MHVCFYFKQNLAGPLIYCHIYICIRYDLFFVLECRFEIGNFKNELELLEN